MDLVYINDINRAITSAGYEITRGRQGLVSAPFMLNFHKAAVVSRMGDVEAAETMRMDAAIRRIQAWVRSFSPPACRECGMWRCQDDGRCEWCVGKEEQEWKGECACGAREYIEGLCADCYWEEDARDKRARRALRPPPPIRIPVRDLEEEEEDDNDHMFEREGWGPRVY
jgi:hypothetical protein